MCGGCKLMTLPEALTYLGLPASIILGILALYVILQIAGEIIELTGKVVPEFFKIRKYFKRKKQEKEDSDKTLREVKDLLVESKTLLAEVNKHYSNDNITQRDCWMTEVNNTMQWVHTRADAYDASIVQINDSLLEAANQLKENTKMTEEMFVQTSRDRIIDFATRVGNPDTLVSREEFHRIFKVYDTYETFLSTRNLTNGEIDINYQIIKDAYAYRTTHHSFLEEIKGYNPSN